MKYLHALGRSLSQPSAWRGIMFLLTAGGVYLKPEMQEHIVAVGLAIAGLIGVVVPDPEGPADLGPR